MNRQANTYMHDLFLYIGWFAYVDKRVDPVATATVDFYMQ